METVKQPKPEATTVTTPGEQPVHLTCRGCGEADGEVPLGNRISITGWLIPNRNLLPTVLEAGLKVKERQIPCLGRACFLIDGAFRREEGGVRGSLSGLLQKHYPIHEGSTFPKAPPPNLSP